MRNCCLCHRPLGREFWQMRLMIKFAWGSELIDEDENEDDMEYACKKCVELAEKLINKEERK